MPGAVESALKGLNAVVDIDIKFFYEQTLAKVKEALATEHSEGRAAFQSACEEGGEVGFRRGGEEGVERIG